MKITEIGIKNFRLLKSFSLDLEDDLSLVIGKNNTGKTSILTALEKFLNPSDRKKFTFDDFNVDLQKQLVELITGSTKIPKASDYSPLGIFLTISITYDESDNLSQVSKLVMSLDPDNKNITLTFDYSISHDQLNAMWTTFTLENEKYHDDPTLFLKERHQDFFGGIGKRSVLQSDHSTYVDLVQESINLQDVIAFKFISAKRGVTNKDTDKTLSGQTSRIYKKSSETGHSQEAAENFKYKLRETDQQLSEIYGDLFSAVLDKVAKFGGITPNESKIKIASTLQHRELLEDNTTVFYAHEDHELPEHYNGLGYMNLISMIFEIEILLFELKRLPTEKPAAINILFIEEPEAHTHPQMQYVFIKNIKDLLAEGKKREDGLEINLQTLVSTHSSHIVAECEFDDVKYLRRENSSAGIIAKNLSSLEQAYSDTDEEKDAEYKQYYKFLQQYLTLNRAEIFFADKVILIEGETERILLPAMMKKIDQESDGQEAVPLLSQNISVIEVGAHAQTFEKFIDFVGIRTLIITDIDSSYEKPVLDEDGNEETYKNGSPKTKTVKCPAGDDSASNTSNNALLFFHDKTPSDIEYFLKLERTEKVLAKDGDKWTLSETGNLMICYQTEEERYHGRSFEDSFFHINRDLLGDDADRFPSLTKKWFNEYTAPEAKISAFDFAEKAVNSKPSLAIEVLLNSKTDQGKDFSNWAVPSYIREGLEWLRA